MTCKDCLHFDVCDRSSRMMWTAMEGKTECDDFADRSRYVVREKDVVMNPVRKYRTRYSDDYCPVCGKQQKTAKRSMEKPWYCERCGQKLGWDGFNQFPEPPMRKGEDG